MYVSDGLILILGQVWCLVVSIPELYPLSYFVKPNIKVMYILVTHCQVSASGPTLRACHQIDMFTSSNTCKIDIACCFKI